MDFFILGRINPDRNASSRTQALGELAWLPGKQAARVR
jgi:hypothetical protein